MGRIRVALIGGSGYGGAELIRILLFHPQADLTVAVARSQAGRRVDHVHPNLAGFTELTFAGLDDVEDWRGFDCIFLALPHGQSQALVPELPRGPAIVDLAGDFRLSEASDFERYYGTLHHAPALLKEFSYGLADVFPDQSSRARRIANPGCFATAVTLALYPPVAAGLLAERVVADAKTGSSGSGTVCKPTTHHPRRSNSFFAYKAFSHQHLPEIRQTLARVAPKWKGEILLQTHSAPMVRGIFVSIYCRLRKAVDEAGLRRLFRESYSRSPFVRIREGSPDVNWVKNTNFADLGWALSGRDLVLFAAIDNLVKGAAGQAVQNMNLMFGFPQEAGLVSAGSHP